MVLALDSRPVKTEEDKQEDVRRFGYIVAAIIKKRTAAKPAIHQKNFNWLQYLWK